MGCCGVKVKENTDIKVENFDINQIWEKKHTLIELEPNLLTSEDKEKKEKEEIYLEEFSKKFDYFNICWYDPNHSNDCIEFKKAFENVVSVRGFSIESIINYFNTYASLEEFILICPGESGKILIPQIHDNRSIKNIIIYCLNPDIHREWTKKFIKIKAVISEEKKLFDELNKININYYFPEYNYDLRSKEISYIYFDFKKIDKNGYSNHLIETLKRESDGVFDLIFKNKNKYKIFCIKMINYLKNNKKEFINILQSSNSNFIAKILGYNKKKIKIMEKELNEFCLFMENLTFLSLYIIKCPYLIESFSYEEVEKIIEQKIDYELLKEKYDKSKNLLNFLDNSIKNNKNILFEEIDKLKNLHEFILSYILKTNESSFLFKYYLSLRNIMSFDFCLKFFFRQLYEDEIDDEKVDNIYQDFDSSIFFEDKLKKFRSDLNYISEMNDINCDNPMLSFQEMQKIDKKRNIIVFESKTLKNLIKSIEKNLEINSIVYLEFNDKLKDDLARHIKNGQYWKLNFIIVLNLKDSIKYYSQLHLISIELGITFSLVIFLENNNIYIHKLSLNFLSYIPIYLVNDINQFIKFVNEWNSIFNVPSVQENKEFINDICEELNIPIKKNSKMEKNNGWALIENEDDDLIKNCVFFKYSGELYDLSLVISYIIFLYKDNSLLDLFLKKYCCFFCSDIDPRFCFDVSVAKKFIYLYTIEESPKNNSFYWILNKELRSGVQEKIAPFIEMIAYIEKEIKNKDLLSYKGIVYRGTCLTEDLIEEIKPGKIMTNSSFWSSTKDYKIAEKFIKNSDKNNALIIIDSNGNNIDVDSEKLSKFPKEKEVLFIPFTPFKVINKYKSTIENKLINFIILHQDLSSSNKCSYDNMIPINFEY